MTEEVKFIRGNDRINQLAQRPDIADGVNRVRAEMAEADRTQRPRAGSGTQWLVERGHRWSSLRPSKIVNIFVSRCHRSTGYSRV
jgi:hypothetical protein